MLGIVQSSSQDGPWTNIGDGEAGWDMYLASIGKMSLCFYAVKYNVWLTKYV